ncbi:tyrosine-type recombinase/integrase [Pediococcus ethanolidurans]|uniref:Phage integrase family site-specific recombinase n=1 Tax=Pediococcus ethanolidurans TaxID=319653 RepID=A0A0R2JZZ7_9LACO|nr:site-specific integrase [Pediococcus ethanolidurans]KRN82862.1 phage integrase family site-specific recombinase [Pediococcus ethanolidurans]GEN94729.1 prophage P1 protein 1, integrase [Pediococcus ethanolidurans]SER18902.1 Phage integrase, N-terminal SAM-like domain [Pediococcus ethanolidurans]
MTQKWKLLKRYPNIYEYQTQKGKRYGIRRHYTDFEHSHPEFTRSGFQSREDASAVLKAFEDKLYNNTLPTGRRQNETLSQYFEKLSNEKLKTKQWRKISYDNYKRIFDNHLKPTFGNTPLDKIDRRRYQDLINSKIDDGYSRSMIQTVNHVMQMILNNAETFDVINKNKLKRIEIIGGKPAKNQTIEDSDYQKWIETAQNILPPFYFALVRMLTLGERREELMGLRFNSFEFSRDKGIESCAIKFDTARNPVEKDGTGLKTRAAYRTIVVNGDMCQIIHDMLDESKKIRIKHKQTILQNDFVAVSLKRGKPLSAMTVDRMFNKVSDQSGIRINPHKLRHYFATLAKDQKLSDTSIMRWLGHSHIDMTNYYAQPNQDSILRVFKGVSNKI